MAVAANTTQTYGVVGRREDLTDVIHDVSPTDTPFQSAIQKGKCSSTFHEWQTDALAAADGSNAVIEGDTVANDAIAPTVRLGNYTQLMDKVISVSSSQRAANNAGRGDELSYQLMKKSKELKRDIETRITGNYASVAGNSSTARQLAGFEAWIQTNDSRGTGGANTAFAGGIQAAATDGTQRAFTQTLLQDVLQLCWENGGEPTMVMVGGFNKKTASGFAGIATQYRENSGQKAATVLASADVFVSDFGTVNIVANRFSRPRSALVVDPTMFKLCYYQGFKTEDLAKDGHADRKMLSVELTLESCNEKGSGVVADPATYEPVGYEAVAAGAGSSGPAAQAEAVKASAARARDYMADYQNPYLKEVVDTSLADYDVNAGKARAQQSAQAAKNRTGRSSSPPGWPIPTRAGSPPPPVNAQLGTQTNQFNARETNENKRLDAQLGTQAGIATAGFQNDARRYGAETKNQFARQQTEWEFGANSQNANNANQLGMFNVGQANEGLYRNMDAHNRAGEFGANAFNQGELANTMYRQQAGAANMEANNQFALQDYSGQLQRNLTQGGIDAGALQFNAAAGNQFALANMQAQEAALARQMQGAGLFADMGNSYAANQRSDLGLAATLGGQQRDIAQQYAQAPLQQLATMGQLYGQAPFGLFNGKTMTESGTGKGKTTEMSRDSLFNIGVQLAGMMAGAPVGPIGTGS